MVIMESTVKTLGIQNRRYLGNKYKLLPFIRSVVDAECRDVQVVADIFAGTGAVASAFADRQLITNDILYSNYICHVAWFSPQAYSPAKIARLIAQLNALEPQQDNYMSDNFADTFFSARDCRRIGAIREEIEELYRRRRINRRERGMLILSLLYAMDKIAQTCGHYDAYRKGAAFDRPLELMIPTPPLHNDPGNRCFHIDANQLVRRIHADLVYIDPPYNSRQYCDTYHLLENVARWEKPEVTGVARKMDRSGLKSAYCTISAAQAFADLISHTQARYILLSYNNMAAKGDGRSNAKITDQDILRILGEKGEVRTFSASYKPFTTGKSHITENEERLFLCVCAEHRP